MPYRPESELKRPDLKGNFTCTVCGKIFCHSSSLNRHRMNVHVQSHRCTLCDQEIPKEESLRSHMQTRHLVSRVFFCRCCNWAFPDKKNLHLHTMSMMRGAGPGDCQILARNDGGPLLNPQELQEMLDSSTSSSPSSSSHPHGSESPASAASPTRNHTSTTQKPAIVPRSAAPAVSRKRPAPTTAPSLLPADTQEQIKKIAAILSQSGGLQMANGSGEAPVLGGNGDISAWLQAFILNNAGLLNGNGGAEKSFLENDHKMVEVKLSGDSMNGDALRLSGNNESALSVEVSSADSSTTTPSPSVGEGTPAAATTPASSVSSSAPPRKNRRKMLTPRHHVEAPTVIDDPSVVDWNDNSKLAAEVMY